MGVAVRTVRELERRAIRKIAADPELRDTWLRYLRGEL